MTDLILSDQQPDLFMPPDAVKDTLHRLKLYLEWMGDLHWTQPDLAAYRDYLLKEYVGRSGQPLSPSSVAAHLSTVRGRYVALLRDNRLRDLLYSMTPDDAAPADRKAFVDEALERMRNAIHADQSPVRVIKEQDVDDAKHLRLSGDQASALLAAPGLDSIVGLRDTALIALMLCTGIREMELVALDVDDLRTRLGGELALRVREGKGAKARSIPYGQLEWCLAIVDRWLTVAGIESGAVMRSFWKGYKKLRPGIDNKIPRLSVRAVNDIVGFYPVMIEGRMRTVKPHDLRRTYARRLYDTGMEVVAIQQNLGHTDLKTTLGYIGTLDAKKRRAPQIYSFDLNQLHYAEKRLL